MLSQVKINMFSLRNACFWVSCRYLKVFANMAFRHLEAVDYTSNEITKVEYLVKPTANK